MAGGVVDLSLGSPTDAPPAAAVAALRHVVPEAALLEAAAAWIERRFAVQVPPTAVAGCIGTKELIAGLPALLRRRRPDRDSVLYPALAYPTYEMGATLAGLRPVPVAVADGDLDLASISREDAERALCLWVNSPANPSGAVGDLGAAARWGRMHGVPVFSDECYVEYTWDGPPRTILEHGLDGVVAVHSLSKRSNLPHVRVGFFAGDQELVAYLRRARHHAGRIIPDASIAAGVAALRDDDHVDSQRAAYTERLELLRAGLEPLCGDVAAPAGGFFLWVTSPAHGSGWDLTERFASVAGALVAPGDTFGPAGAAHVRVAAVQPADRLELVVSRLHPVAGSRTPGGLLARHR